MLKKGQTYFKNFNIHKGSSKNFASDIINSLNAKVTIL